MEFEVLGPLRVRRDGQPAPVTATMPRTLLGILLARANLPVPADVLVDALWPGQHDPRAAKNLQLHVHRLRRALGDPARIRFDAGYCLRVHPGELDAERFERGLAEADLAEPASAARRLRAALALWRGEPFGGVADVPLLRAEADRLTELRLVGLERLYAAELARGRAGAIVPELGELAARYPLRERLQSLLMTALYQSGRRAEALEVYQRTRTALVEELALEPGADLQRLERAILTGDPALEVVAPSPPTVPAQLPADITDFLGREDQLATLHRHLAPQRTGQHGAVPVAVIAGKAGVGKTTLAVHVAHQLRHQYPDGQLYVNLRGVEAQALEPAEVLARFLRALGVNSAAIPKDVEERAALYRSRLAGRRLLVLLDNAASEAQVRPLLPGTRGCAVLVTSRARLAGLHGALPVDLDILEPDQAVQLLGRIAGEHRVPEERSAADQIVRLCGFLPLAVRVAGVRLGARPHWRLAQLASELADEHRRLDALRLGDLEVRASLALSFESLDVAARTAFRRLGLLEATDFPAWVAAALLDTSQAEAERLLDVLVDTQLLDVTGYDSAGQLRYRFHDLLRAYARELVAAQEEPAERRAALERVFGGWVSLAEHAAQRMVSSAFGVRFEPVRCWRPEETVRCVVTDPAGWFHAEWLALVGAVAQAAALGASTHSPPPAENGPARRNGAATPAEPADGRADADELAFALGTRLAPFYIVRGYYDDWQQVCELMLTVARRRGSRRWEGMVLRGLAELALLQYHLDRALVHFTEALAAFEAAGDEHGQALALSGVGAVHVEAGRFDEALPRLVRALEAFRLQQDRRSEAWALRRLGTLHRLQGSYEQAAVCFRQALDVLDGLGDPLGSASVLERLGVVRTQQGHQREARELLERSLGLRKEHGDHFGVARTLQRLGELHRSAGDYSQAMDCLAESLRLWRHLRLCREQAATLARMAEVHEDAGDLDAAARVRREARRLFDELDVTGERALLPLR